MWSFPTLEPVISNSGSFEVERILSRPGEVLVGVGESVTADQVVARSEEVEQAVTLYIASELGVESSDVGKYLAKSVGSSVSEGDIVARVRRGLRTATVKSPINGTLVGIDEASGTAILNASTGRRELQSFVQGQVERIIPELGVVVRTSGTRIYGIAGFGGEASGKLVVGADRPDRELTSDHVSKDWKDAIVLAGMTAGGPALNKLREVGVAGVILGSLSEGDIRRFLSNGQQEAPGFWSHAARLDGELILSGYEAPFVIIVTEGFGRRAMTDAIYDQLRQHEGESCSIIAETTIGDQLRRPQIYFTSADSAGEAAERLDASPALDRAVRLVGMSSIGETGVCVREPYQQVDAYGIRHEVVDVRCESGEVRTVPVTNVEVLV